MATIITNPNYLQIDGARIQKGTRDIIPLAGGVRLQNVGNGSNVDIIAEGTTIDGVEVGSVEDLVSFLDSQGFKSGGGDGIGVADITGIDPGNLIFGGAEGNEQRKLMPSDLGITTGGKVPVHWSGNVFSDVTIGKGNTADAIAQRTTTGQIRASNAIEDYEVMTLAQFKGIVNDTLTDSETSTTLNTAYGSAIVGTRVTAPTALTEYTKISPTQWSKKTIEIV